MENKQKSGTWLALGLAFQLGYMIAIPAVVFALVGRVLDKKFETSPYLLILGILVALVISSISVYKKSMSIMKETTDDTDNADKTNNNRPEGT